MSQCQPSVNAFCSLLIKTRGPNLLIPAGNWAEWAAAVLAGLTLLYLVIDLVRRRGAERALRQEDAFLKLSAQARDVGAWIGREDVPSQGYKFVMRLVNSSKLPIKHINGYVLTSDYSALVTSFDEHVALPPTAEPYGGIWTSDPNAPDIKLVLAFNDDADVRWRKYGPSGGLEVLEPGADDLRGLAGH